MRSFIVLQASVEILKPYSAISPDPVLETKKLPMMSLGAFSYFTSEWHLTRSDLSSVLIHTHCYPQSK